MNRKEEEETWRCSVTKKEIIGKDSVREMQSDEVYWKISLSSAKRLADG